MSDYIDFAVVGSAHDCQLHCRSSAECRFFTFYTDTNKCYRKRSDRARSPRGEAVSGPRECGAGVTTAPSGPTTPSNCRAADVVCLVGGNSSSGNVFVAGKPVCDDQWSTADGRVVCRELGYVDVVRVTRESHFGRVANDFAMDDVACDGTETRLALCRHNSR